jgi:N-acyl-D-aspartate/D-glutamate deacylase
MFSRTLPAKPFFAVPRARGDRNDAQDQAGAGSQGDLESRPGAAVFGSAADNDERIASDQSTMNWQCLIRNARVFDGTGHASAIEDVAVADGRIAARGPGLDATRAERVIDATGLWLMPGLLDIHTHLDLEVELAPGLPESVRHGTTTVVVGNCSLGTAFGAQRRNGDDPILDCFTRVENIPKPVLRSRGRPHGLADDRRIFRASRTPAAWPEYRAVVAALDAAYRSHGHQRGGDPRTHRRRTRAHGVAARRRDGQGYLGLSTDAIPFHYLANEPHQDKRVPAQHASFAELKQLLDVVRRADRVWQCTPDASSRFKTFLRFCFTSGRLFGSH